ncbi:uncharacterized protein LOC133805922 [Humulus lupulus]|uniref:uncharacterized protein LOC133805922 n=1 Tax=Humulus lupulus TaxID=3486 RepID=UPI002B406726|nr:uncharacterized protein LOC133805922 [Humulus lupulus]
MTTSTVPPMAPAMATFPPLIPPSDAAPPSVASSSTNPEGIGQAMLSSSSPVHHSSPLPAIYLSSRAPPVGINGGFRVLVASTTTTCQPSQLDRTYHLGTGDNPNFLISPKILTGQENFQSWKRAASISIAAKNKTQFINGSLPQPPPSDPYFDAWVQCNSMVMAWLLQSVSQEIAASIMFQESASDMWNDLHERFNQGNGPKIF